jgi:hypothetical protein
MQSSREERQKQTNGYQFLGFSLRFLGTFAPMRWISVFGAITLEHRVKTLLQLARSCRIIVPVTQFVVPVRHHFLVR